MKLQIWALLILLLAGCALPSPAQVPVNAQSFGMDMTAAVVQQADPWPSSPFGTSRLFEVSTSWGDINTAAGTYDFTPLDTWLILAKLHGNSGLQYIYTLGVVPTWASSSPGDTKCSYGPGTCDPPSDVNTTDQNFKTFMTTLMKHLVSLGNPITYFECGTRRRTRRSGTAARSNWYTHGTGCARDHQAIQSQRQNPDTAHWRLSGFKQQSLLCGRQARFLVPVRHPQRR